MVLLQPAGLGASCGSAVPEAKSSVLVLVSSGHVLGISCFELGLSAVSILLLSVGASRVHTKLCLGQSPSWLVLLPVPLALSLFGGTCTPLLLGENGRAPHRSGCPHREKVSCAQVEKAQFSDLAGQVSLPLRA